TAQSMRPGSVCRHLKIAGRAIISRFFHVTSQQPRKLQHILPVSPISPSVPQRRSNSDSWLVGAWFSPFQPRSIDGTRGRTCCPDHAVDIYCWPEIPTSASSRCAPSAPSTAGPDGRDSSQTNPPTLQLDKEQHVVGNQPF